MPSLPLEADGHGITHRRRARRRQPARARRDARLRGARGELPADPRRAPRRRRSPDLRHLPAGGRRRLHGGGARQARRPAGHRARHARPRRLQRGDRHPHRGPGLDADGRAGRPGRHRIGGPRGIPGNRLPAHVRQRRQVGRAGRPCGTDSRVPVARVRDRDVRSPRSRGAGAAGGRARDARGRGGPAARIAGGRRPHRRRRARGARASRERRPARWCWSAAAAGTATPVPH